MRIQVKVIFLDVDGVLNGYNFWTDLLIKFCRLFHLQKWFINRFDIFDVRDRYLKRLKKLVDKTGASVVISSSWRHQWYKSYEEKSDRSKSLEDGLRKYQINVIGITPRIPSGSREIEISSWLETTHYEVISFVILDDENFGLLETYPDNFVCTSNTGVIYGHWSENTGLKRRNVWKAIKILNQR